MMYIPLRANFRAYPLLPSVWLGDRRYGLQDKYMLSMALSFRRSVTNICGIVLILKLIRYLVFSVEISVCILPSLCMLLPYNFLCFQKPKLH